MEFEMKEKNSGHSLGIFWSCMEKQAKNSNSKSIFRYREKGTM